MIILVDTQWVVASWLQSLQPNSLLDFILQSIVTFLFLSLTTIYCPSSSSTQYSLPSPTRKIQTTKQSSRCRVICNTTTIRFRHQPQNLKLQLVLYRADQNDELLASSSSVANLNYSHAMDSNKRYLYIIIFSFQIFYIFDVLKLRVFI